MKLIKPLAMLLICATTLSLSANAGNNKNKDKDKTQKNKKNQVPIDGGISLLFVAGAALGAKKVLDNNKKDVSPAQIA